jgi:hypothetical protein
VKPLPKPYRSRAEQWKHRLTTSLIYDFLYHAPSALLNEHIIGNDKEVARETTKLRWGRRLLTAPHINSVFGKSILEQCICVDTLADNKHRAA